jgi:hypothetical protein
VQTLLDDGPGSTGLQVKHVLHVSGQRNHADEEVRALGVGHGLKTLLPHWILLVMNRKERDWHHGGVGEAALTQGGECDLCHQLDPNDGCHPRLRQVEGYHHIDLALVLAMGHRHVTAVDRSVPVVAELEECVVQHSREPRAMLACGAKAPILSDGDVGVVAHVHLKTQPYKHHQPQSNHLGEIKYRKWNEVNSSKKTVKTVLLGNNSIPKLNTNNMGNSPSFPSVTHTVLSAKQFRRYRILKIDFAADFCFWAEQRLNGT